MVISRSYCKFKQHACCRNKGEYRNNALWRLLGAVGQAGVAPCEVNRISLGFWIPSCGFRISLSAGHGFRILIFSQLNSEIQSPGWRIPQGKISRIHNLDNLTCGDWRLHSFFFFSFDIILMCLDIQRTCHFIVD